MNLCFPFLFRIARNALSSKKYRGCLYVSDTIPCHYSFGNLLREKINGCVSFCEISGFDFPAFFWRVCINQQFYRKKRISSAYPGSSFGVSRISGRFFTASCLTKAEGRWFFFLLEEAISSMLFLALPLESARDASMETNRLTASSFLQALPPLMREPLPKAE